MDLKLLKTWKLWNNWELFKHTQLKGLKFYDDIQQRIPYLEIIDHEKILKTILNEIDSTAELTIAGSFRKGKKTRVDIDVLIKTPSVKNNSIFNQFWISDWIIW